MKKVISRKRSKRNLRNLQITKELRQKGKPRQSKYALKTRTEERALQDQRDGQSRGINLSAEAGDTQ